MTLSFFSILAITIPYFASSLTPQQLQNDLNNAISDANTKSYRIPPGDYHFINTNFQIFNAVNFEIISSDKAILYFNCSYEVSIVNNTNVTITNLIIDYDPPCFSQGILDSMNITESSLMVSIDDGYPLPDKSINPYFNVPVIKVIYWNSTTRDMIVGQPVSNHMNSSKQITENKYEIYLQTNIKQYIPNIGDLITIGPRKGGTFLCTNCTNMKVINLTIYASTNMACVEMYGGGNNLYDNYQLIRRPNSKHLITSNADAFHSNCNLKGPVLRNSKLMYPGDDFVNVHNRMNILLDRVSDNEVYIIDTLNSKTFINVKPNDYIYFYHLNSLQYLGYGIVDILNISRNQTLIQQARQSENVMNNPPYNAKFIPNYTETLVVYYVRFKNKLNVNITAYWSLVQYDLNNGAIIENNYFYNGYSGICKLKSSNSIFRNNRAEYTHSGVMVAAEQSWMEGNLGLRNIIVENNVIIGCAVNKTKVIVVPSVDVNVTVINNTITN